nr:MAG TPA: hypothetical protein [Caudoviricetes sp.]
MPGLARCFTCHACHVSFRTNVNAACNGQCCLCAGLSFTI